jgi:cytosine deaminase
MTRVPELMDAGIKVAFGHDCVMDPWYSLGSADMLEVASIGLHLAQMTGVEQMKSCFQAITEVPAAILGLEGYGLEKGCNADLVILQAKDAVEALRLKANRLFVIRRGKVISTSPPAESHLNLQGRPKIQKFLVL